MGPIEHLPSKFHVADRDNPEVCSRCEAQYPCAPVIEAFNLKRLSRKNQLLYLARLKATNPYYFPTLGEIYRKEEKVDRRTVEDEPTNGSS